MTRKNPTTAVLVLFSALFLTSVPVSSYAEEITENHFTENTEHAAPNENMLMPNDTHNEPASDGAGAAKGCATGAAIGTAFAPGVGTLAGCIVAGIWGWFW